MSTVRRGEKDPVREWTVADLQRRFGPIAFGRIRQHPPPGSATEHDVLRLNDHEDRLYELVDGILVEKTVGIEESLLAGMLLTLINNHILPRNWDSPPGRMACTAFHNGLVRIPDVVVRLLGSIPRRPVSQGTHPRPRPRPRGRGHQPEQHPERDEREAEGVLQEGSPPGLVRAGPIRARWMCTQSAEAFTRLTTSATLDGGEVLPGFSVLVGRSVHEAEAPGRGKPNGKRRKV